MSQMNMLMCGQDEEGEPRNLATAIEAAVFSDTLADPEEACLADTVTLAEPMPDHEDDEWPGLMAAADAD